MNKTRTVLLAVFFLAALSIPAQAVTVLMDENFDSWGVDVDPNSSVTPGSGWVNNNGTTSRMVTVSPVEGSTMGVKGYYDGYGSGTPSSYSYAVSNVVLAAGERYRFEGYMSIPGAGNQEMAMFELLHSDGRYIQYVLGNDGGLTQHTRTSDGSIIGGSAVGRKQTTITSSTVRVGLDIDATGITSEYDVGNGWISLGQALATTNSGLGFTGGLTEFRVKLFTNNWLNPAMADTFSLTVTSEEPPPKALSIVEVPGAPTGYRTYDFLAEVNTHMGAMEFILDTDTPGDIYQNPSSAGPNYAADDYDTYVTVGDPEQPANTTIFGGAVGIVTGVRSETFDNQNLDIAWGPSAALQTGAGSFQVARVTLKNSASGSWTLRGWPNFSDPAFTIDGTIEPVASVEPLLPGDFDLDGDRGRR